MTATHPHLLQAEETLLVVVDMQEPFLRHIFERDKVIENVLLLMRSANILRVPIIATVQYADRMGGAISEVAAELQQEQKLTFDKMTFSALGQPAFRQKIQEMGRRQILLCGVETHICVTQTALECLTSGFQPHVAADAVSSRTLEKHKLGMERMRDSGVLPCAAEAALYELMNKAGTLEFKSVLKLVR